MTSDSITEQAEDASFSLPLPPGVEDVARALWDAAEDTSQRTPLPWDYVVRKAEDGSDVHAAIQRTYLAEAQRAVAEVLGEAPATEDEAAEVQWAIAYGDDPTDASTEYQNRADAEARLERLRKKHADLILVTRTVTPWREVAR